MKPMGFILIFIGLCITGFGVASVLNSCRNENNDQSRKEINYASNERSNILPEPAYNNDPLTPQLSPKEKGNMFEDYVANLFKDKDTFKVLEWNQGTTSSEGVYAENELNPDFKIEQSCENDFKLTFWVESKFRRSLNNDVFSFDERQLNRYRKIQKESRLKIFLAIGKGEDPSNPSSFYFIPLDSITGSEINFEALKNYYMNDPSKRLPQWIKDYFFNKVFPDSKKKKHR